MWGGKINVRILRIIDTTSFSIRIVRRSHFAEVTAGPCVNGDAEHDSVEEQEGDRTKAVGDFPL